MLEFFVYAIWVISYFLVIPIISMLYGFSRIDKKLDWHSPPKLSGYWRCCVVYPIIYFLCAFTSQCDFDLESHAVYHKDEKVPTEIVDYFNEQKKYPNVKFTINKGVKV